MPSPGACVFPTFTSMAAATDANTTALRPLTTERHPAVLFVNHLVGEQLPRREAAAPRMVPVVPGAGLGTTRAGRRTPRSSVDLGDFGRTEPVAVLDTIGVHPGYRHRCVGHALLSQLFVNLGGLRIERVETVVAPHDLELLGFLYAVGFAPSQRIPFARPVSRAA